MAYDTDEMTRRQYEPCQICFIKPAEAWHHCLIHRMKDVPELDRIYNLEHVCHNCHAFANGYGHRRVFWWKQFRRYGKEFIDWWDSLPLKATKEFDAERKRADSDRV